MFCKNCNYELNDSADYCPRCGAKVIRNRLTFRNLLEHFTETFLNIDNLFLRTFYHLIKKPEEVIDGYINGTRKSYMDVLAYFALALTFSGIQIFILDKFFPEIFDFSSFSEPGMAEFQKKNMDFMKEYQSIIIFIYVPIYALIGKLVFFNIKKYNYTEFFVIFLYILSEINIVSFFITLIAGVFSLRIDLLGLYIMIPMQILYSAYCLKRLYGLNMSGILLRTILFFAIGGVVFFVVILIVLGVLFYTGELQEFINAQREAIQNAKSPAG